MTVRAGEEYQHTAAPAPLWQPSFPSPELVHHAADLIPHISTGMLGEEAVLTEGNLDECPGCGCPDADLVEAGGADRAASGATAA